MSIQPSASARIVLAASGGSMAICAALRLEAGFLLIPAGIIFAYALGFLILAAIGAFDDDA